MCIAADAGRHRTRDSTVDACTPLDPGGACVDIH